jgi:phage gp46-like protein
MSGIDAKLYKEDWGWDFRLDANGDIETEDAFDAAIIVSLFTDARADESEVFLPQMRRGWIGNEATPGVEMGSKLWLYHQSKLTDDVRVRMADEAKSALQWMVDDGYADSVTAEMLGTELTVTIFRPHSQVEKRHYDLWSGTGV